MSGTPVLLGAQGTLLGQLAGDALGAYVEFDTAGEVSARHPDGVTEIRAGGHWDLLADQPTDDSELALALARCIVAQGGFDPEDGSIAYVDWLRSGPFDCGTTIRQGLEALRGRGRANAGS